MIHKRGYLNWLVDAFLFGLFLLEFFMDFTGLELHQWFGVLAGCAAGYHLFLHRQWFVAALHNLFTRSGDKMRRNAIVDIAVLAGFGMIGFTGILISSWLNLDLDFGLWKNIHVFSAIFTLLVVVLKIGLHGRWILNIGRRMISRLDEPRRANVLAPVLVANQAETVIRSGRDRMDRRGFLVMMGFVSVSSTAAIINVLSGQAKVASSLEKGIDAASSQDDNLTASTADEASVSLTSVDQELQGEPTAVPTKATVSVSSTQCRIRCNKKCSYPGRCGRYQDTNNDQKCDNGECL